VPPRLEAKRLGAQRGTTGKAVARLIPVLAERSYDSDFELDRTKPTLYAPHPMKLVPLLAVVFLAVGCASQSHKFQYMSTPELKLRHTQLVEEVAQPPREKENIEFELLHRWEAGDRAAYLPQFSL
jgi:hypothetical protein